MTSKLQRGIGATLAAATVTAVVASPALAGKPGTTETMSPSTGTQPYVLPVAPGVQTTSMLTVGEDVDGYRMVGIPDGLGAYRNDGRSLTLLMNHELRDTQGVARRHGQKGAFVSDWSIDRDTLEVTSGEDLIDPGVQYWDYTAGAYALAASGPFGQAFARFCSNTLSDPGQLLNEDSGNGYDGQLFFPNEENGDNGRSFGLTTGGAMAQLPRLGLFSWENTIPAPNQSDTTLVMGQEDGAQGADLGLCGDQAGLRHAIRPGRSHERREPRRRGRRRDHRQGVPRRLRQGQPAALHAQRGRLGPDRRRAERGGQGGGDLAQPRRGRSLGSRQPERLLLPHHGGRQGRRRADGLRTAVTAADSGGCASTTSSSPSWAAR